jgi:hypothetical protein
MTRDGLYEFLARHKLGVLSSIAGANTPQSALVGIAVTPELEIIFDTVRNTRKYPNLKTNPRCSFVVGWEAEQTVQYEGEAEELQGLELKRRQEVYFQAWPDGPSRLSWPGIVYFVVKPRWIRYSDFAQDPPLIEEFAFGDAND